MASEFWRLSAAEAAALVRARKVSAREIAEDALARLEQANPAIAAVAEATPELALEGADAVDAALARGEDPGPLAGATVTIKVNVDQAGYATTNGVRANAALRAEVDSPVVANLKKAGALIIGRTNTPAFSLRWFCRNSLHGHTKNPRNPALTPGGSSGGAAAAVAAGVGAIGHGTDIAGSIRYPAYACGVHGLRPSLGRAPAINFATPDRLLGPQLMAVSGPIARTIADLRLALEAMAAFDPRDPWAHPAPIDQGPIEKRAALAVAPDGLQTDPAVEAALRDAAARLEAAGWRVVETETPPLRAADRINALLWMAEYRLGVDAAVRAEGDPDSVFVLDQMLERSPPADLEGMMAALQERMVLRRAWRVFLAEHQVLLCPVSGEPPFPDLLDVESPAAFRRCMAAQLLQTAIPALSLPGLTVSTGLHDGGPIGVQLVADSFREDVLLAAGAAIEAGGAPASPIDPASAPAS